MPNSKKIFFLLFFLLILERVVLCVILPPIIEPDTVSYKSHAISLLETGDLAEGRNFRTPGYPLFLYLIYSIHKSDTAVVIAQHLLGLLLILLITLIVPRHRTKNIILLFFLLDMQLIRYEHSILADFPLAFFLGVSIYFFLKYLREPNNNFLMSCGLFLSIGFITKPILKLYPYLVAIFLIIFLAKRTEKTFSIIKKTSFLLLPTFLVWSAWSITNYKRQHYFGLAPALGVELGGITEDFWNYSSPLHKEIKKIYKEKLKTKTSKRSSVVHAVVKELKKRYSLPEINKFLLDIAKEAIITNPHRYILRGMRETACFYLSNASVLVFLFLPSDAFYISVLQQLKQRKVSSQVILKFLLNFYPIWWLVLLGFFLNVMKKIANPRSTQISDWFILATILYIGGIASFISLGYARMRTPIEPFIIMWSVAGWQQISHRIKRKKSTSSSKNSSYE